MKKILLSVITVFAIIATSHSQILLQEDFEGPNFPANWTQTTNASDGGWKAGTPSSLSSQFWTIAPNGSSRIAATNDDGCNCDKSRDYLITPVMDFSTVTGVSLSYDVFFGKATYEGATEQATIEVSVDGGTTWTVVDDLAGHPGWHTHQVNLSDYAGEAQVWIAFKYNDHGGFLYGLAIDNATVSVPPATDAGIVDLKFLPYGEENVSTSIAGTIVNNSLALINVMEVAYAVNGGAKKVSHLHGIEILPFEHYDFFLAEPWTPDATGIYEVTVTIESVNGKADDVASNNSMSFETEIFPHVVIPNRIDEFLNTEPVMTTVAIASDGLDKPTDLDFFPILAKNELWVLNERVENIGGSTLTIYEAGTPEQENLHRVDGNAWHFMSLPTGIAFSNNFNFATSTGVKDANHSNGTFTGPALWSSDPEIYAQPSGGNGSHLDMLHASPFCMGIASEEENIFWVTDGFDSTVVRYDFQMDHGPGNDDHADGLVRRYSEISFKKDGSIPSHLVLDKSTGWMYVVDNGNKRVVRLDINSGSVVANLPLINEPLEEHSQMGGVTWEVIIDGLVRPSGIELIENRLLVGDYTTGEIIIYDMDNEFAELGRIATGEQGLTGIKIGPDGGIWFTNRLQNTVIKAEPGEPTNIDETQLAGLVVSPNPFTGKFLIDLPESIPAGIVNLEVVDISGKHVLQLTNINHRQSVDLSSMSDGVYMLSIWSDSFHTTRKVVVKK